MIGAELFFKRPALQRLKFVGIAGVKDEFKGWFSPDRQSVPVIAKMKAFIGSVGIELIRWKNWEG